MLQAKEHASPALPASAQSPLKGSLRQPSLALSCGEAAASQGLDAAAPTMIDTQESIPQHSSQLPAAQGTMKSAGHRELEVTTMAGADNNQEASAEARIGPGGQAPQHRVHGADAQCYVTIEHQMEATAIATAPDQVPHDDLPLTSLFGSAEAAALEQHSHRSAGRPEASQRPSADSAASLPASQESNQENQLPPADDALHRCILSAVEAPDPLHCTGTMYSRKHM